MKVLLFGITRDIVGDSVIHFSEDIPKTVAELKTKIYELYPKFAGLKSLSIAVNSNYADDTIQLQKTDEIALIPPVSGG